MKSDFELVRFLEDGQDSKMVVKIIDKISAFIAPYEKIAYIAIQKKSPLNLFPDCLVLTSQRIYLGEFTTFGRILKPYIFDWDQILDIQLEENAAFGTLKIVPNTEIDYIFEYLPVLQARKVVQLSEQFRLGSDVIPETKPAIIAPVAMPSTSMVEESSVEDSRIAKLRRLYERQLITKSEFEQKLKDYQNL